MVPLNGELKLGVACRSFDMEVLLSYSYPR